MSIYDIEIKTNKGEMETLRKYKGKVLLIVNTASKCGFTPQYKDLQALYDKYRDKGLEILAFPCNQFGGQEPGSDQEIQSFCELNYQVSFPVFSKIEVNGRNTHPLYQLLKQEVPGILGTKDIKWNFTKFLVNAQGEVLKRYASATSPLEIEQEIQRLL